MAATTVRYEAVVRLLERLAQHPELGGTQLAPGWPGDDLANECVWVGDLDGTVLIPVMTDGRKHRDDKFDIPLEVRVSNRRDLDDTYLRLAEITAAIEDTLAVDTDATTLGQLDGIVSAEITSERMTCARTREGHFGFAEILVSVHARLT